MAVDRAVALVQPNTPSMQRARILAAVLSLAASGAPLALALHVFSEGEALAGSPRAFGAGSAARKAATSRTAKSPGDRTEPDPSVCSTKVRDGHSGEMRCALSEELAAKGSPDLVTIEPVDAGSRGSPGDESPPPAVPGRLPADGRRDAADGGPGTARSNSVSVSVSVEALTFANGDVPRAAAALDRMRKDFARCALEGQGPVRNEAAIDLRFLVRAPGRAEGVDVVQSKGVPADVVKCVALVLANRLVGAPSDDPVGVSTTLRFKKD